MRRHLTYANIVASIALLLAMTGGAVAASQLGKNTVGSKQLKKNSVNSLKVRDGSLRAADFKAGQLPAGEKGATGPQGAPGTAKAYGTVLAAGTIATGSFGGLQVTKQSTGQYCVSLADGGSVAAMQVTTDYSSSSTTYWSNATQVYTIAGIANNQACGDNGKLVNVYKIDNDAPSMAFADAQFRVIVP